jgi:glycine/D-amino acid oxidase-like deaminating enzyme
MKPTSGTTLSVWAATTAESQASPLAENASANVCIIGAGIAGLTTAYLLAKEGKAVIVLDDGPIGGGMTARTTAHLTNALDDRFYELERLFGERSSGLHCYVE